MARRMMFLILLAFAPYVADSRAMRASRTFLGASMQPAAVAHTLQNVVDEWRAQATLFVGCNSQDIKENSLVNCQDAPSAFGKSCGIVLGAVVQGSNGNKRTAHEYMTDVCGQSIIIGWQKQQCKALALALDNAMTADSYENRWGFPSKEACDSMWSHILKEQEKRVADKKVARETFERKAAETEKLSREAAQKEASAQVAREKVEEVALKKAEAQARAKAAAELAAQKMAEAEVVAKAAQEKAAEVAQAEREQEELMTKVKKVQPKVAPATSKVIVAAAPSKVESVPALVNVKVAPVESEPAQTKVNASVRAKAVAVLLQTEMQPEMVAHTLKNVEGEWRAQAVLFAGCDPKETEASTLVNCQDAPASFGKSCGIVVGAIIQGSNGDNTVIQEYMSSVCSQSIITGWRKKQCQDLARTLNNAMTGDSYENRNNFHSQKVCDSMWSRLLQEEHSSAAAEKVAREVEAKKAAEAYKFSQEEKAAARARGAAEKAAAESEQQKLEEDARQKADVQAQAKAAADLVAQAETFAKAAKQKAAEAAEAERQRKELMAKVSKGTKAETSPPKVAAAPIAVVHPSKLTVSPHHVMPEPKLPHKRLLVPRLAAAEAIIATRGNSVEVKTALVNAKAVTPAKAQAVLPLAEMKVTEHAQEKAVALVKKQEIAPLQASPKQVHSWQRIAALISLASQQKGA